ncbi:MAG TPA: hypothetical protein VM287_10370, partial [Egibacteraceae bacterium]|nr:hypothetical protein [Egibacteraceae bacterium]
MTLRYGLVESRMRWKPHVRFGGRAREPGQPRGWHRALVRPHYDANTAWVAPDWAYRFRVDLGIDGAFPRDQAGPAQVNLLNGNVSVRLASPTFPTVGGPTGVSLVYNSQAPTEGLHARYYLDDGGHNLDS